MTGSKLNCVFLQMINLTMNNFSITYFFPLHNASKDIQCYSKFSAYNVKSGKAI